MTREIVDFPTMKSSLQMRKLVPLANVKIEQTHISTRIVFLYLVSCFFGMGCSFSPMLNMRV
jgi:hypothetical protein